MNGQTHLNTQQPTNFVSVFDHFVGLVLQEIKENQLYNPM